MIETRGAGARFARRGLFLLLWRDVSHPKRVGVVRVQTRLCRLWRGRGNGRRSTAGVPDAGWEHRVEALEARMEHLEAELEGPQDALHRQAVLEGEHVGELRRRTTPAWLARDLSQDARNRGL
jgi:hypothetical protein